MPSRSGRSISLLNAGCLCNGYGIQAVHRLDFRRLSMQVTDLCAFMGVIDPFCLWLSWPYFQSIGELMAVRR